MSRFQLYAEEYEAIKKAEKETRDHIHKKYWRRGFGSEAARAVRDWAFENTNYDCLYSYMKYTNVGSYSTAMANGMKKIKEYPDEKNTISYAYAITRKEWNALSQTKP